MTAAAPPFICAYVLDRRGGGRAVDAAGVESWTPEQGLLWVHLDVLSSPDAHWLRSSGGIDDIVADGLLAGETRPRSVPREDGLLVVLRGVNTNPGADPDDMVAIRVWLERDRIITSRRRRLLSIQDIREGIVGGQGPRTSGEFLVTLIERLTNRIDDVVEGIETGLDAIEDETPEAEFGQTRGRLGALRRQTAAVRRYLAPQREALDRLSRQPAALLSDDESDDVRERADRLTRLLEDLDLSRERAILLQEELLGRLAHEQSTRMYLLSVVAAVFLPLTFVTGLLGMNVAGLPGTESSSAFAWSLIVMGALGILLVVVFKWKKWI